MDMLQYLGCGPRLITRWRERLRSAFKERMNLSGGDGSLEGR
jgi:hypothetical protein